MVKKITLITASLILSAPMVFACKCEPPPVVREEFERSDLAMTVRIESFKKATLRTGEKPAIVSALMIVEKVYKGVYTPGAKLLIEHIGSAACGFNFKESDKGRRMLLYKIERFDSVSRLWFATSCSRNAFIEEAYEDIAYLDKLDKVAGKSRISGTVYFRSNAGDKPLEGVKIKITGREKTFELASDANGVFEIYDMPPGPYMIDAEQRKDYTLGSMLTLSEQPYFKGSRPYDFPGNVDPETEKYRRYISLKPRGHVSIQMIYYQ